MSTQEVFLATSETRVNKLKKFSSRGEVRCMRDASPQVWMDAMKEISDETKRLNEEGWDVEVHFKNQIDEYTPCNFDRSLFYFQYLGVKP